MIDVVFQLLIFFLLTASLAAQQSVQVPEAEHGVGIDPAAATYITLSQAPQGNGRATVLLGDGKGGAATNDAEVRHWIVQGRNQNRNLVVLKAEGHVFHGDVRRVAQIVAGVEGVSLHVAVREKP